jgi:hypothetical protein
MDMQRKDSWMWIAQEYAIDESTIFLVLKYYAKTKDEKNRKGGVPRCLRDDRLFSIRKAH